MKLLTLTALCGCFAWILPAQSEAPKSRMTHIWFRSAGDIGARFDGIVAHEPAFVGEDKMRARLQLLNRGNVSVFVNAFDLSSSENDRALLHDVFDGEQCRQALHSNKRNDDAGGALGIGYSRLHTSSILEIRPGDSLQFSVPLDHLSGRRCVRVRYWLESANPPLSGDGYRFLWLGPSR